MAEMGLLQEQIAKRRTFAIISHPDAGKTTLTEKLLLYGGAIHLAGSVKARKSSRHAVSDWMEIEKQRGISVTSSAMQFSYKGFHINILDTPGHQDFSEDTYRTLVAADSAVMLIDGAKGVEPQTIKLFHVCRMRGIPIFTFINKMDRAAKHPFELMDEIEQVLGIASSPINWPIRVEGDFKGIYHRDTKLVELYDEADHHGAAQVESITGTLEDPEIQQRLGSYYIEKLQEEIELLDGAVDALDMERVKQGQLTPMFFGSAMNNFGVEVFLNRFLEYSLPPQPRQSDQGPIDPFSENFSALVFKIQANMDPAHRDRLAFIRICSGRFVKGMEARLIQQKKTVKLTQPQQFMAQERETVEEAVAGDIIGLFDPGIYHLGDTLAAGNASFRYEGIPMFAPEYFARVAPVDSLKRKQFVKGINQLAEEGAIQTFRRLDIGLEEHIVGVVGVLQFDVLKFRLEREYGANVQMERLPFRFVRWVKNEGLKPESLSLVSTTRPAADEDGRLVLLFENEWSIQWALEHNTGLELSDTAPRTMKE